MPAGSPVQRRRCVLLALMVSAWTAVSAAAAPPTITITSPTSNPTTTVFDPGILIGGTASDDTGIASVTWHTPSSGPFDATGTTSWTAFVPLPLFSTTLITVTATDLDGETATDTLLVTALPFGPIHPPPGVGIDSPTSPATVTTATIALMGKIIALDPLLSSGWTNDRGGSGALNLAPPSAVRLYGVASIALFPGVNVITVHATTFQGTGTASVTVTYTPQYHFAEGATGGFFQTDLLLANPNNVEAPITIQYQHDSGQVVDQTMTLAAMSRTTVAVHEVPGLLPGGVSSVVTSIGNLPLAVERTMRWDSRGYGGHTEKASDGPGTTWYFAEGSQGFFSAFLLLSNPNDTANSASVEYLIEGASSVTRTYPMGPLSRVTVDLGQEASLVNTSFGMVVTFAQPGIAERSMYFGANPLWAAGHASAGVTAPATEWLLAEGATGPFFETFILMANPGNDVATVTMTFLTDGPAIERTVVVPPRGRVTINPEGQDPALSNAAVATRLVSSHPIVAERAQYWPGPPSDWTEAHNSFGVTEAATRWALAEGRVGGVEQYQTYVLLANPGTVSADVTLTFLRASQPPVTKVVTVPPSSRVNVSVGPGTLVPELTNEAFGVLLDSTAPIVVERAMYWDALGQTWGAGTDATATKLPLP